jgi:bifunctional DNA-binding transcriptional regulator/antitoxin component of YhaV-PrlF toxin-antitoxin module
VAIEELKKIGLSGHSYFVVLPKKYVYALGLKRRDFVIIRLSDSRIEITAYERNNQCQKKS